MPGQTVPGSGGADGCHVASMEGRAIARPNDLRVEGDYTFLSASMEGRAIARPNHGISYGSCFGYAASMEGRAIARPNLGVALP